MEFKEFFTEVGKCVEIVDKYTGQEIEHMEVALFEGRLKKLFDDLTKPVLRPIMPSRAAIRELVRAVEWLMNEFNEIPSPSKSYGAWNHINQSVKKVKRQMKRKK